MFFDKTAKSVCPTLATDCVAFISVHLSFTANRDPERTPNTILSTTRISSSHIFLHHSFSFFIWINIAKFQWLTDMLNCMLLAMVNSAIKAFFACSSSGHQSSSKKLPHWCNWRNLICNRDELLHYSNWREDDKDQETFVDLKIQIGPQIRIYVFKTAH